MTIVEDRRAVNAGRHFRAGPQHRDPPEMTDAERVRNCAGLHPVMEVEAVLFRRVRRERRGELGHVDESLRVVVVEPFTARARVRAEKRVSFDGRAVDVKRVHVNVDGQPALIAWVPRDDVELRLSAQRREPREIIEQHVRVEPAQHRLVALQNPTARVSLRRQRPRDGVEVTGEPTLEAHRVHAVSERREQRLKTGNRPSARHRGP